MRSFITLLAFAVLSLSSCTRCYECTTSMTFASDPGLNSEETVRACNMTKKKKADMEQSMSYSGAFVNGEFRPDGETTYKCR